MAEKKTIDPRTLEDAQELTRTAMQIVGPRQKGQSMAEYNASIVEAVTTVHDTLTEQSDPMRMALAFSDPDNKTFVATIARVEKEKSSKRAIVGLVTKVSQYSPKGVEVVRTDRTDGRDSVRTLALIEQLIEMSAGDTPHRALVHVRMENMANSTNKVRVIYHVRDLGPDSEVTDQQLDDADELVEEKRSKKG